MTAPAYPLRANAELAVAAYVRTIVTAYDTAVGAVLQGPDDQGVLRWARAGFVQFTVIGDPVNLTVPVRRSVVSLDVWAASEASKRPPWNRAYAIAETIIAAQYDTATHDTHAVVSLPTGYPAARVTEFSIIEGPKRVLADAADFAHLAMTCAITWHGL